MSIKNRVIAKIIKYYSNNPINNAPSLKILYIKMYQKKLLLILSINKK